jgi:hypothetical protein
MTAQETKLFNAFETTLTATAGASDLTFTVNSVTAPTSVTLAVPFYLVINPDSSTNREVVEITSINTGTKTLTCSAIGKRYLAGSAASSGLSHASGSTVRMSPVQQHIEDLNDRVDTIINEDGTAVNTSLFLDEDDMSTDSATKGVTQQSVKAYVDAQVTAQDLDLISDSGTIDIDLDSESLTVSGGEGIDTSATGTTLTIAGEDASTSNKGIASFSSDNFSVSSGDVTIKAGGVDLTAEVTGTLPVANGGTNISSFTAGDLLYASGTTALSKLAKGTAGQVLAMNSGATAPEWTSDTDTTYTAGDGLDLSGTEFSTDLKSNGGLVIESTELAVDLGASSITGTLDVGDGGTGLTGITSGDILYASGTDTIAKLGKGTAGQVLKMNSGATAPEWGTDSSTTYTAGDGLDLSSTEFSVDLKSNGGLVIESTEVAVDLGASSITGTLDETDGGTGLTGYTAGDVIYASGTDTLAKLAKGSAGQVLTMNSGATAPEWSSDSDTTYSAGTLLDLATTTFNVDLSEASEAAIADGDYVMFLDGGASGTAAKEAIGDIATLFAGTGLTASSSVIGVDTSQNITALTGGDLTIYEDANNADVSVKMGTSATESLTIEVLNGGSNKTAEQINFTTATASTTANHGKMVFNVDETEIATIDDGGIDLASGMEFSVNGTAIGGSATALIDGDSDFTLADGVANGIHYELDNTDMADWNQGGVALTAAGGIFRHNQTQSATYTIAATEGTVLAGPITITGTVTNAGTMVIL